MSPHTDTYNERVCVHECTIVGVVVVCTGDSN